MDIFEEIVAAKKINMPVVLATVVANRPEFANKIPNQAKYCNS